VIPRAAGEADEEFRRCSKETAIGGSHGEDVGRRVRITETAQRRHRVELGVGLETQLPRQNDLGEVTGADICGGLGHRRLPGFRCQHFCRREQPRPEARLVPVR
jgi:hypothetical protein